MKVHMEAKSGLQINNFQLLTNFIVWIYLNSAFTYLKTNEPRSYILILPYLI